ncbi:16S rRNA processing protein RimM [Ectothiorhodosinus mongolicus]|uniref:Ribosome maturation factor RimM n=1 Tax=Ectothiorhodosinus mongolicus TaxID=233100 RepID=A0A1R3W101_9GAMM|nr:ribosome maturation factor RimM [Ectothiorhodosinus mongolicus]ULX57334.1 ribosome maturation factor RimM [Ectothiorhodosinus mongolicus]SIT71022.1 16S rRNA processing protein RimM [Ectothiorhodosinus mongolicus]
MVVHDAVILGRIVGVYGIKGWVKVFSETQPREGILNYQPLYIADGDSWQPLAVETGRLSGKSIILKCQGVDDRDAAQGLVGRALAIDADQLPQLDPGEYYWSQLLGLEVVNLQGEPLGRVDHLLETGANDVLVLEGERQRLVPYVPQVVKQVDLVQGRMTVDWGADF